MQPIQIGIIGMGFIGTSHLETALRIGGVRVRAVSDANTALAQSKADEYGVEMCYKTVDEMIADPQIDVIHNCTPNHMHLAINEQIIRAGKHVFSEKPLGRTAAESARMIALLKAHPEVVAGVNFCYRMNPLIQDAKNRIQAGELGESLLVHGQYLQDWLLYETDYNWRVESAYAGPSRCVADIGSHWIDLAQTVLGSHISSVCAMTRTVYPIRKKSTGETKTFSKADAGPLVDVSVDTEDYAGALIRFENGTTGVFQCSQVSAGRKCNIALEVNGSKASFAWQHETSDQMWKGYRDQNNELVMRNPLLMLPESRKYSHLPAGHPEGWNDAFRNTLASFYQQVRRPVEERGRCDFATFEDGHYIMLVTEAIMLSAKEGRWVALEEME